MSFIYQDDALDFNTANAISVAITYCFGIDSRETERLKPLEVIDFRKQLSKGEIVDFDFDMDDIHFSVHCEPGSISLSSNDKTNAKTARRVRSVNKNLNKYVNPRFMFATKDRRAKKQ